MANLKLTAAQCRILGTHFTAAAYKHALSVVNIAESFKKRGYIGPTSDCSHIGNAVPAARGLGNYTRIQAE